MFSQSDVLDVNISSQVDKHHKNILPQNIVAPDYFHLHPLLFDFDVCRNRSCRLKENRCIIFIRQVLRNQTQWKFRPVPLKIRIV